MCYDFLMLTDVLKIVLRQHVYRGFYDKMPSFFAVFLAYLKYLLYVSTTKNLNNIEKEEPIIRRVYRKSLNYGATVVSVYHTLLSQLYHRGCHGRSMGIVTPVPWSWKDRVLLGGTSVSTSVVTTVPKKTEISKSYHIHTNDYVE